MQTSHQRDSMIFIHRIPQSTAIPPLFSTFEAFDSTLKKKYWKSYHQSFPSELTPLCSVRPSSREVFSYHYIEHINPQIYNI